MQRVGRAQIRLAPLAAFDALAALRDPAWLHDDERRRLDAMASPLRRRQFLAGHWLLRELAAEHHGGDAAAWLLTRDDHGAPRLQAPTGIDAVLHASISHSSDWVAVAIAGEAIGLDIETGAKPRDLPSLAEFLFSPEECAALVQVDDARRAAHFYLHWTLKEAWGKRQGTGLRPQRTRRQTPHEVGAGQATMLSWQRPDRLLVMALAGSRGLRADVSGWPGVDAPRYWDVVETG